MGPSRSGMRRWASSRTRACGRARRTRGGVCIRPDCFETVGNPGGRGRGRVVADDEGSELRREAAAEGVLATGAGFNELEEVVGPPRLGADAGEAEAAEALAGDQRCGEADRH